MSDQKISALLGISLFAAPMAHTDPIRPSAPTTQPIASSQRTSLRTLKTLAALPSVLEPMGTYVGQLQEKWQLPSDHLPIGITYNDAHFVSWNVLNAKYMGWLTEKNTQGISRSIIADEHIYIDGSQLTIRDKHVASLIVDMTLHPTHPRSILSLQECSGPFLDELRNRLPSHFRIVAEDQDAILIDTRLFEVTESKAVSGVFADAPERTFQELMVRNLSTGEKLRLLNAHLPGDPDKPARFEFANYLQKTFDPALAAIAMGDMNFNELEMADAIAKANAPFSVHSPYCTNISPYIFRSKAIDHFLLYSPSCAISLSAPDEVLAGLEILANLLKGD